MWFTKMHKTFSKSKLKYKRVYEKENTKRKPITLRIKIAHRNL